MSAHDTTEHETTDAGMYKMMAYVMGALCILALVIGIFANILAGDGYDPSDQVLRNALVQRIEPVGKIRTAAMAEAEGETVEAAGDTAMAAAADMSPQQLYDGACAACHAAGVANAPKFGDAAAWAERNALGLETLVASVVNGKGAMPAKGGSTYSDEDITRAVKYLTGIE